MVPDHAHGLVNELMDGRISRGAFVGRALALGLTMGALAPILDLYDRSTAEAAGVTLNFLADSRSEFTKMMQLVPSFTKQTGIKIAMSQQQETPLRAKTGLELSAPSTNFDIIMTDFQLMRRYASAGVLEPMDTYLKGTTFKASDYQGPFLEALRYKGKLYGLPLYQDCNILMYRADIFEQLKLRVPDTMTDLQNVARAITAADKSKGMYGIALRGQRGMGVNEWTFPAFLEAFGGRYYKNYPKDLHPALDTPQAVAALTYYVNLIKSYAPPGAANYSYVEVQNDLIQGRASMIIDSATLGIRAEDPKQSPVAGKLGYALVPKGPGGRHPGFYTWAVVIPVHSQHKAAAAKFLAWLLSPQIAPQIGWSAPNQALNKVYNIPAYKGYSQSQPLITVMKQSLAIADPDYRPRVPQEDEVGTAISVAISNAIAGTQSPAQALKQANAQVTQIMHQAGYF